MAAGLLLFGLAPAFGQDMETTEVASTDESSPNRPFQVGAFLGGVGGATGVGIIAQLTLRAMGEWNAVNHPEATSPQKKR